MDQHTSPSLPLSPPHPPVRSVSDSEPTCIEKDTVLTMSTHVKVVRGITAVTTTNSSSREMSALCDYVIKLRSLVEEQFYKCSHYVKSR